MLPLAVDVGAPASVGALAPAGGAEAVDATASVEALATPSMLSGIFASEPSDVSGGAALEVSVVAPEVSVAFVVAPEVSDVAPEVSDVAPEESVVSPEVSDVAPEVSDAAPSEAGGGGGSARAVATNAEAQRNAATSAAVHPRTPGDPRPSERGNRMLRTTTQLPSSNALLTMAYVRLWISEYRT